MSNSSFRLLRVLSATMGQEGGKYHDRNNPYNTTLICRIFPDRENGVSILFAGY
jgi:hypothetical protein